MKPFTSPHGCFLYLSSVETLKTDESHYCQHTPASFCLTLPIKTTVLFTRTSADTCSWSRVLACSGLGCKSSHGTAHHEWWLPHRWCSTHSPGWPYTGSNSGRSCISNILNKTHKFCIEEKPSADERLTWVSVTVAVLGASGLVREIVYMISLVWFPASSFFQGWYTTSVNGCVKMMCENWI